MYKAESDGSVCEITSEQKKQTKSKVLCTNIIIILTYLLIRSMFGVPN